MDTERRSGPRRRFAKAALLETWHSRLWRRQTLALAGLVFVSLGLFGAIEIAAWYRSATAQAYQVQLALAQEAGHAVRSAMDTIGRHVAAVTALPWSTGGWLTVQARREEYGRLLRLVPSIESVAFFDGRGQEVLAVSRKDVDRVLTRDAAANDMPSDAPPAALKSFGRIEYVNDHDPVLKFTLRFPENAAAGTTVVTIGLRALARELGPALEAKNAEIYVTDGDGTVILHVDPVVMLERKRLALATPPAASAATQGATGLSGVEVLRSWIDVEPFGWRAVVEQPRAQVMAPVWATVRRTGLLAAAGLCGAVVVAMVLAGRLTRPIRSLHAAAASMGQGQLDTRVDLRTRDELREVGEQFNRMAHNLQESYAHLEQKVAEKTRDLELANRHMAEFLANMSHELRTPLNAVIGMSEALLDEVDYGGLNPKQREYLTDINASGAHLLALINDILDLAKVEAGRVEMRAEPIDILSAIDSAIALLRQRAMRQRLAFRKEVDPGVGIWDADPRRFKQILVNLLSNAVKFTPPGGTITVRAGVGEALWVEVHDTGCGIAPQDQPLIFQKFQRIGAADGQTEGTGLGLSLVRELVRLHGGDITLTSVVGVGSIFRFTIPRSTA